MFTDHCDQSLAIFSSQEVNHTLVLFAYDGEQCGITNTVGTDRVGLQRHLLDHFDKWQIAANSEKCSMELKVLSENRSKIALLSGCRMSILNFLEGADDIRLGGKRYQLRGTSFDKCPDKIKLFDLVGAVISNSSPAVRLPDDDTHHLEIRKRLSDNVPFDPEALGKFLFNEPLTRRQLTEGNLLFKSIDNICDAKCPHPRFGRLHAKSLRGQNNAVS